MKRTHPLFLSTCALVCALGCGVERPPALAPIKLGVLYPESGALTQGSVRADAAILAAEQVNAGGGLFDGRPLELVLLDTEGSGATAAKRAKDLVNEGVVGIVGPETSGESAEVIPVAKDAKIPMISCCATSTRLTEGNQPNQGFFFRTTPSDELQGQALAYLARQGVSGAAEANPCPLTALLYRDDAYGAGFETVYRARYEGKDIAGAATNGVIVTSFGYDSDGDQASLNADALTFVNEIGTTLFQDTAQPEMCVVVISFDTDGGQMVSEVDARMTEMIAARAGAGFALPFHFLTADGANSAAFAAAIGGIGARLVGTVPYHGTGAAYDQFKTAYQARFELDSEPIAFTAQNFDAVFLLSLAITKSRSDDGKKVRDALFEISGAAGGDRVEGKFFGEIAARLLSGDEVDYAGPSGELTFDAFGDVVGDYVLWQVASDGEGGYAVYERQPLLASEFTALE